MDEKLQALRDRQLELNQEAQGVIALADKENRDATDDELARLQAIEVESAKLGKEIDARASISRQRDALAKPQGRRTDPAPLGRDEDDRTHLAGDRHPMAQAVKLPAEPRSRDGRLGFKHFGEYAKSVQLACMKGSGPMDRRLEQLAPGTYGSEASGADGGFAVPPDFRAAIMQKVGGQDSLLDRTSKMVTTSNSVSIPTDETTPWGGTGIQAYWTGEAAQLTGTKPLLQKTQFDLHKLTALVKVTDELLGDAPALDSYLKQRTPVAINWKVNEALVTGTGVGMPSGILNSPAKVRVTKVSGQATATIVYQNILSMWSRLYGPWRQNAVWLANQDTEPQLAQMYLSTGSTGFPVYLPPGGVSQSQYSTLMGRPVVPLENCSALGSEGDLILVAFDQYQTVTKVEPIRQEMSIHLYFDYDVTAFRWILRLGGRPMWSAPVARENGANTLGFCVTVEDRP